jgi:hypothetical protein
MPGREFLELARELLALGTKPKHWRGILIHANYALFLECREAMARRMLPSPPQHLAHRTVRLRLVFATDPDLKALGFALDDLGQHRNAASYDLRPLALFSSAKHAQEGVKRVEDALALLDAIEADPTRLAAAVASIKP